MSRSSDPSLRATLANWRRPLFIFLAALLLSSLACSVPLLGRGGTPTPAPTLAPTISLAQPAEGQGTPESTTQAPRPAVNRPLPPALVEAQPLPGSQVGPVTAPVFYFNQPMDRGSVEAALKVKSGQTGRFDWLNDSTVRFTPSQPAAADTGLDVTIGTGAKAANGLSMAEPVIIHYAGAGPLRLAERLPAPNAQEVNPSSAIVATFSQPVVALGAEASDLPAAFTLEPAAQGRGEWLNTSTYIFYPQPELSGGANYTVSVNPDLTSTDGSPLDPGSKTGWSFATAAPALLSVQPSTEQPVLLDAGFTLTFNQLMDKASVESSFSLARPDGSLVEGAFTWNDAATEVTFQPAVLLERGASYRLVLLGSARSQGGAAIGQDFVAVLSSVPQFSVIHTQPAAGESLQSYSGYGTIILSFSSPLAPGQDFERLITITPAVLSMDVNRDQDGNQLYINGYFQPSTSYTVTVQPDLKDRFGATLDSPFSFTFNSQTAAPSLLITARQIGAQALFLPQDEKSIPARATNITRIDLKRGALSLEDFILAGGDYQGLRNWQPLVQEEWSAAVRQGQDINEPVDIPISRDQAALAAGLYFLQVETQPASASRSETPTPPLLMVVSPVQMMVKTSAGQAFVWAVRLADNSTVAGAKVDFYDRLARVMGSCVTSPEGKCQADLPPRDDPYEAIYAVLGQPGQPDFSLAASSWSQGVTSYAFGLPYDAGSNGPQVYLYTDRPIYRPGQSVNFRLVARSKDNGRYTAAPWSQLTLEVVAPYNPTANQTQVLTTLPVTLDAFGSAAGSFTLAEDARPGTYVLRIQEVQYQDVYFEVAEYRKPEIDLQVKFDNPDVLAGADLQAKVTARYFFGAPAGNLTAHWSLIRSNGYLDIPGGLSVGPLDTSWQDPYPFMGLSGLYVWDGQANIGPDGNLTLTIPGQAVKDRVGKAINSLQELTLEVRVEDESGLPVAARDTLRLHPAPYYIGARSEVWSGQAGQSMTFAVRTVDWAGSPVADKPLSARFTRVEWKRQESNDPYAPPQYTAEYSDIGSTDFRTSASGDARLAFTPEDPGTYMLEISGDAGALTQVLAWIGGPGSAPWPSPPNQRVLLRSDASSYKPGQTARIFIPNPFQGGALALVTVERGKVMQSSVVQVPDASYELELPITNAYAPNIYVSVTLLGRTNNRPDFRMGYLDLTVDPAAELLQVEVQASPAQPQPGGDLTLNIRVKDSDGNPVQGEFSLALIDKAVLALANPNAQPISEAFYGHQPLGVQNSLSLAVYASRLVYSPPGRGGGGGGEAISPPSVRTKFEDTAYWNGSIKTDVTGVATVTLTLPDNLTTWRADARGVSGDTRVGQANLDLVVGKPLLVSPVTPRFAVAGDHMELAALVFNNTQSALKVSVRLEGSGFRLDDLNQAAQPLDLPAGERRRVSWWGTVQDLPALDLTFSVDTQPGADTALHDAARPEINPLPVLHYASPQTFGTAGVLPEAGERLELVSLPRSFKPAGGELTLELSPSLTAAVFEGLKALEAYPYDFTEPVLSRLLPNLATRQAIKDLNLQNAALANALDKPITTSTNRLMSLQNEDGGWGWSAGAASDPYISSYALLGLVRAAQSGVFVEDQAVQNARNYLESKLFAPSTGSESRQLDRLAFQFYALQQAGNTDLDLAPLYGFRDKLSPWGKGFLALALYGQNPADERARTLISDLEAGASRSATGASWQDASPGWHNWSTPSFTTAVSAYAIATIDPASQVLTDAVRYLVLNRQPNGGWKSSYETSWVLMALTEAVRGTGDVQAGYTFSASLNDSPLIHGKVESASEATSPLLSSVPLSQLLPDQPNALSVQRDDGIGRLYYRAFLRADQPAEEAPAVQRGLSIERQYYLAGQDCRKQACQPLEAISLENPQPVQVRLTLTVPEDMYYVVVEDNIPAGSEVLNVRLKTSQQAVAPLPDGEPATQFDPANPFEEGWGWWLFQDPQVYDDHVRWVVDYLPAGTYELTYRLTPYLAGEFRALPARAWQYYFPDVQAASKGEVVTIR